MTPECHGALTRLAIDAAANDLCPSVVWGVVAGGELIADGSTGTVGEVAPTRHTIYRVASMTKSFTAAVVLALRDEGAFSLDDPVAKHAPELAAVTGPPGSSPITIRHLLSMSSGLATDDSWADRHLDIDASEIDEIYRGGAAFAHRPGTAYEYSNLGFAMIGRVVERVTGRRVQQHVDARLLEPLGMTRTTWVQPLHDDWARPFRVEDGASRPDHPAPLGDGELAPMGGLWSCVADLATWVAWLDAATTDPVNGVHVAGLSTGSRREMQRMHTYIGITTVAERSSPAGYGFGLNVRDDSTLGTVVAHAGGLPGYGSNMRWLSGRGVGAIALANSTYAPMSALTLRMLATLHEHGVVPMPPAPDASRLEAAGRRLVALLDDWDDRAADVLFADNVALDESIERRRVAARRFRGAHGPLRFVAVRAESATSGRVDLQGTGEVMSILIDLAPLPSAPLQFYELPG